MRRLHTIVLTSAGALALVAGGTAAGAAIAGPVDGTGVVHACYTNAAAKGSHVVVLQDAGSSCPSGTTAVSWNQQGPAGPAGAAGQAGATGPAGPAGSQGPAGPQGPKGDTGAQGPAGPAGSAGSVAGSPCTFPGGQSGTISVTTSAVGAMTLTCSSPACTHDTGLQASTNGTDWTEIMYVYCGSPPGTPGDQSTYDANMALNAAKAFVGATGSSPQQQNYADCDGGSDNALVLSYATEGFVITWTFAGPNAGRVLQNPSSTQQCPGGSDPTWT
jgi:Collagen triple helix repeat (20 copies)